MIHLRSGLCSISHKPRNSTISLPQSQLCIVILRLELLHPLYGNLETDVYFDCELHSPYGATLQAFASLVGVKYTVLGEILGMVAGEIVPTGTGVLRYICVALFSKDGRIGGSTYYDAVHQIIYYGIDYANTSSYALDNSPISNTYSPSQSIYNSNSTILTNTFNAYLSTL